MTEEIKEVKKAPVKRTVKKTETADVTPAKKAPAKATAAKKTKTAKTELKVFLGTGKRKKSIARVRLSVGTGNITINNRDIKDYFDLETHIIISKQPLVLTETVNNIDIKANIIGGGLSGQAGALRLGITRALMEYDETLRPSLKKAGYVTRDARVKERKKYGLKKARKAPQFSKR